MNINANIIIINIIAIPIQIGDKTHHHDQLMYLVNFRTMKTKVNNPGNPIPELELFDFVLIFILFNIF